jgi:hypothetical protein
LLAVIHRRDTLTAAGIQRALEAARRQVLKAAATRVPQGNHAIFKFLLDSIHAIINGGLSKLQKQDAASIFSPSTRSRFASLACAMSPRNNRAEQDWT